MTAAKSQLFTLGSVVATPGALAALASHYGYMHGLLVRHARGDWGDVDAHDKRVNDMALVHGERVLSAYTSPTGEKVWVITEADRASTCVLLPDEY